MDEEVLDFEASMRQFCTMFPRLPRATIETVLREHDGRVADTIDELLTKQHLLESHPDQPSSSSSSSSRSLTHAAYAPKPSQSQPPPPPPTNNRYSIPVTAEDVLRERRAIERRLQENDRRLDSTADIGTARMLEDEQIALMLQNREFLHYIRQDRELMRALYSDHHRQRQQSPCCQEEEEYARYHNRTPRLSLTSARRPPDGPPVPDGPLVDMERPRGRNSLTEKLRRRLEPTSPTAVGRLAENPSTTLPQDEGVGATWSPHTRWVDFDSQPPSSTPMARIKTMTKETRQRLSQMAHRFQSSSSSSGNQATASASSLNHYYY